MTTLEWARVSTDAFNVALYAYIGAMLLYFAYLAFDAKAAWALGKSVAIVGVAANLVSVVARGYAANRYPWGNMYEFTTLSTMLLVGGYLVIVEGIYKVRKLGGFILAWAVFSMALAVVKLEVPPGPLVPALNSYWRQIHVTSMIAASSVLSIGCIVSILYLFKVVSEDRAAARATTTDDASDAAAMPPIMGGSIDVNEAPPYFEEGADEPQGSERQGVLPSSATLDKVAYRILAFGFPIWTFGVICGAIWAQSAWGRYWGWDPKETWSFITWVIFAGYLHARATSGWKGRRAAVIACVGFVSIFITYYAVNLWIAGLHSYAR